MTGFNLSLHSAHTVEDALLGWKLGIVELEQAGKA